MSKRIYFRNFKKANFIYPKNCLPLWIKNFLYKNNTSGKYELSEIQTGTEFTLNNTVSRKFNIFDLKGNTIQNGEPTPEIPIPIQNVSGNNNIKIQNKNLFDKNNATLYERYINSNTGYDYWQTSSDSYSVAIPCEPNKTYTISHSQSGTTIFRYGYITTDLSGQLEDLIPIYNKYVGTTQTSGTLITGDNATYIIFQANKALMPDVINSLQIEYGSTATPYVPHQEQNLPFTFSEGQKAMQGTTLQDDGIHQVRGEVVFDGSRTWHLTTVGNSYCFWIRSNTVNNCLYKKHYKDCNYFTYSNETYQNAPTPSLCENDIEDSYSSMFLFKTDGSQGTTVEAWQQYLQNLYNNGTPLRVIYQLREEEIISYSETQATQYNAIKQAISYDDQTNISQTNDDLPFILDIQYWKLKEI